MNKIQRAQMLAHAAHDAIEQKRKYTKLPYWVHTDEVAAILETVTSDEDMLSAAHLHDVEEDVAPVNSAFDHELILAMFGERTAGLVTELTHVYTKETHPGMNRAERKELERKRIAGTSNDGKTIKLADIISNSADISANDPDFAKTYLREMTELLPALVGGDERLWKRAQQQITESKLALGLE